MILGVQFQKNFFFFCWFFFVVTINILERHFYLQQGAFSSIIKESCNHVSSQ